MRDLTPLPHSPEEDAAWQTLVARVPELYHRLAADPRLPQTVVVIPSLSLDPRELSKVAGVWHYEERMLVNLMLLRQPRTRIIFVTSAPLDPAVIDFYLAMLPGVPTSHARERLILLDCADRSNRPLTQKILERPRLIHRIRHAIEAHENSHMVCFNATTLERSLAVQLDLPLHAVDPKLYDLGTKSGSREVFRAAGVPLPPGFERLHSAADVAQAIASLAREYTDARRVVVKLNDGFSGEGNATFALDKLDRTWSEAALARQIAQLLPTRLHFEAQEETWEDYITKLREMGGVVELFIEGAHKTSPSAQCRVNGIGQPQVISTHDQLLGGPSGQVFLGCRFPADACYRIEIQAYASRIAAELAKRGVIGRFGVDFVSVEHEGHWTHHAIEINLRKGGTTHPFLMLKFLTDGHCDPSDGLFYAPSGRAKYYIASDTVQSAQYRGLRPDDLVDISVFHDLRFHRPTERGVVFHLIGALSEFGKLGMIAIGDSPEEAQALYDHTLAILDEETA